MSEIPKPLSDPNQMTVEWLNAALANTPGMSDAKISAFESEPVGTGQMGRSARFRLRYEGAPGALSSVVGKFPSDDPKSRATGAAQGAYLREVRFYEELAPTTPMRTPTCYWAGIADDVQIFTLLMEDMAPARQGDQIKGCGPDEAALALEELTKLHAPWWADARLPKADYLSQASPDSGHLLQATYLALWPGFEARYEDRLDRESMDVCRRLGPLLESWVAGSTSAKTLTHGDYRLDNMLFCDEPGRAPLTIVDWQTAGCGAALTDAAYFVGAGLSVEDRREHERALLDHYHAALVASGVGDYDFDACFRDYRRMTFAGVVMAVVASMLVEETARGDEMFLAMAHRHASHAADLEAFDLIV